MQHMEIALDYSNDSDTEIDILTKQRAFVLGINIYVTWKNKQYLSKMCHKYTHACARLNISTH